MGATTGLTGLGLIGAKLGQGSGKSFGDPLRSLLSQFPNPASASVSSGMPDLKAAEDRVRMERDARDAAAKRKGRRSTIATGPEGVGDTPLGIKTLIGT